uniref:Uncharacterized protein n=1 Tax=Oryza glumipatula TaxID=40148 RepID=A0A0D9ZMT4_9ORYZ
MAIEPREEEIQSFNGAMVRGCDAVASPTTPATAVHHCHHHRSSARSRNPNFGRKGRVEGEELTGEKVATGEDSYPRRACVVAAASGLRRAAPRYPRRSSAPSRCAAAALHALERYLGSNIIWTPNQLGET